MCILESLNKDLLTLFNRNPKLFHNNLLQKPLVRVAFVLYLQKSRKMSFILVNFLKMVTFFVVKSA